MNSFYNEEKPLSSNTGSNVSVYTDDQMLSLAITVNQLRSEIAEYMRSKLIEEKVPEIVIKNEVKKRIHTKKRLNRPLLEGEIKEALAKYRVMAQAAEYLYASPKTLRKYMNIYGLMAEYWKPTRGRTAKNFIKGGYCSSSIDRESSNENIIYNDNTTEVNTPTISSSISNDIFITGTEQENGMSFFTEIKQ